MPSLFKPATGSLQINLAVSLRLHQFTSPHKLLLGKGKHPASSWQVVELYGLINARIYVVQHHPVKQGCVPCEAEMSRCMRRSYVNYASGYVANMIEQDIRQDDLAVHAR
jgi:hypothetical protein